MRWKSIKWVRRSYFFMWISFDNWKYSGKLADQTAFVSVLILLALSFFMYVGGGPHCKHQVTPNNNKYPWQWQKTGYHKLNGACLCESPCELVCCTGHNKTQGEQSEDTHAVVWDHKKQLLYTQLSWYNTNQMKSNSRETGLQSLVKYFGFQNVGFGDKNKEGSHLHSNIPCLKPPP